jgi:hypothetical protein
MKLPAGNERRILLAAAAITVPAIAAMFLLSGLLTSDDDGVDRRAAAQTQAPQLAPPEAEGGTIEVPDNWTPPPEVTPPPPTHIEIRGQQVPLAPRMVYFQTYPICDPNACEPGPFWRVEYDPVPSETGYSYLVFEPDYSFVGSNIRPDDQEEFQPIIDALNPE